MCTVFIGAVALWCCSNSDIVLFILLFNLDIYSDTALDDEGTDRRTRRTHRGC